jgi:hypothetical protein
VADIANYNTVNPTKFTAVQYSGRLDADVTLKDRIGFTIYWVPLTRDNFNGNRAYDIFHHSQINDAFSAIWNHTFSPSFLNEARANAAGWRWNEVSSNPQTPVGFPQDSIGTLGSITINSFGPGFPSIHLQGCGHQDLRTPYHQVWRRGDTPLLPARLRLLRRAKIQLLQHVGLPQ